MNPVRRLYRRARYGEPIVVVSGLPRSGTSMTMKMLEAGGMSLVTDGRRTADEDNPKGYFEYEPVKKLGEQTDKSWLNQARGKAVKIISYLLKELPPTHNYKILFMRRNLDEILDSQAKMLQRRGEAAGTEDGRMRQLFEQDLRRVDSLTARASHFERLDVRYRDVLDNPRAQAERIARFVGTALSVDKMTQVVDERLYRNRRQDS